MRKLSRKEQERLNRRTWILDAAESLMRQHGVACVGMEQIARHAECAKGTLYQHFNSKNNLLLALAERDLTAQLDTMTRATEGIRSPLQRILAVFEALLHHRQTAAICYSRHIEALLDDDRSAHQTDAATRDTLDRLKNAIRTTLLSLVHEACLLGDIRDTAREAEVGEALAALLESAQTSHHLQPRNTPHPIRILLTQVLTGLPWAASGAMCEADIEDIRAREATAQSGNDQPEHEPA